jgi:hypothetical protein
MMFVPPPCNKSSYHKGTRMRERESVKLERGKERERVKWCGICDPWPKPLSREEVETIDGERTSKTERERERSSVE